MIALCLIMLAIRQMIMDKTERIRWINALARESLRPVRRRYVKYTKAGY